MFINEESPSSLLGVFRLLLLSFWLICLFSCSD